MCYNPLNRITCSIVKNTEIAKDIYDMEIKVGELVEVAKPGQFVNLYTHNAALLLPRPISICGVDLEKQTLRLVYAVVGEGTKEFKGLRAADVIDVLGPFGNGFSLGKERVQKDVLIVGGGVGTPPLLELAKSLKVRHKEAIKITIVLGYRDEPYLTDEFKAYGDVYCATDSGKVGYKGNVIGLIKERLADGNTLSFNYVFACGPTPMLRGLKALCNEYGMEGEFSLEERMGCGFGGCVGCVVAIASGDDFEYKKVCKDGPIFNYKEVIFE